MKYFRQFILLITVLLMCSVDNGAAQEDISITEKRIKSLLQQNTTSVSGQWFLGYHVGEEGGEKVNQFILRRGYITINKNFSEALSGRITPDISIDREGDGIGSVEMRLKYCYIRYQFPDLFFISKPAIEFGLVHRPWLDFEEHINNYRVQGTMFLERNHIFNSGDYGVTITSDFGGKLAEEYERKVGSHSLGKYGSMAIGIYNGGGYHAIEYNTNKTLEARFTVRPFPILFPGLQFSYHGITGKGNKRLSPEWKLNVGFFSWEHQYFVLTGMVYSGVGNFDGSALDSNGRSLPQNGYSVFGEVKMFNHLFSVLGRFDLFNSKRNYSDRKNKRTILGIAYHFYNKCKLLLNYDSVKYPADKSDSFIEFAVEVSY